MDHATAKLHIQPLGKRPTRPGDLYDSTSLCHPLLSPCQNLWRDARDTWINVPNENVISYHKFHVLYLETAPLITVHDFETGSSTRREPAALHHTLQAKATIRGVACVTFACCTCSPRLTKNDLPAARGSHFIHQVSVRLPNNPTNEAKCCRGMPYSRQQQWNSTNASSPSPCDDDLTSSAIF